MITRCRFCGEKIKSDAEVCEHCGKRLKVNSKSESKKSAIDLDSWQGKTVPAWAMFLIVGVAIFCMFLMFNRGCQNGDVRDKSTDQTSVPRSDQKFSFG